MVKFHRGERLEQVKRLKNNRKGYWGGWAKASPKQLGKVSQYPHPCSCYKCCNISGMKPTMLTALMLADID